ncbi:MAG: ribonuclease T [Gammaproteobacteria bacterium]|nr:ribonuclease T [Gammaproteobacteria bacterium]
MNQPRSPYSRRFRGLMPVVIDVETAGLNPQTDALLEVAAVIVGLGENGKLTPEETHAFHIEPFAGANIEPEALAITGIDPYGPLRYAIPEAQALHRLFTFIKEKLQQVGCYRAVLVGHNAWFDLNFILSAIRRSQIVDSPFHTFTTFDTASLSALALGETVLARATRRAKIPFDMQQAHSAIYDAQRTAELFCFIANRFGINPK